MKKILITFIIFCSIVANAQFTFKTHDKTFTNELTGNTFVVNGIRAIIISGSECNLNDSTFSKTMFLEFRAFNTSDSTTKYIGQQNTTSEEIINKLVKLMPKPQATALVKDIFRKLEYGTKQEKYQAASQLAGSYNYTLKPIEQQE